MLKTIIKVIIKIKTGPDALSDGGFKPKWWWPVCPPAPASNNLPKNWPERGSHILNINKSSQRFLKIDLEDVFGLSLIHISEPTRH
eukprot:11760567-Karenia_brevis.AAC.1